MALIGPEDTFLVWAVRLAAEGFWMWMEDTRLEEVAPASGDAIDFIEDLERFGDVIADLA